MEKEGLTRKDLEAAIGTRTRIAEVLNRKRAGQARGQALSAGTMEALTSHPIEHQEPLRSSGLGLCLSQAHRFGQNTATAIKKVINRIETTIWIRPKFAASRATNQPVMTPATAMTIRTIQPTIAHPSGPAVLVIGTGRAGMSDQGGSPPSTGRPSRSRPGASTRVPALEQTRKALQAGSRAGCQAATRARRERLRAALPRNGA
jgi:hypothetical protein